MDFWVTVLCALLVAILGGLYLLGAFRKRQPGEPPLDKGLIPWIGHGLTFRNNTLDFLQRMQKKHGDIFTALIGGHYFTFLMDPLSVGAVVKESRAKLDFISFASELVSNVFAFRPSEMTHKVIETASAKHLKGTGLEVMTQAMMESLQKVMLHTLGSGEGQKPWQQDGLFHYCYNTLFRAGYFALYGNEPSNDKKEKEKAMKQDLKHSEEIFVEFRKYDQLFPRLSYSMLSYGEKKEVENLWKYFWNIISVKNVYKKDNISGWIHDQQQQLDEAGMPEYMRDRFMFLLLWAAQGNTGPASFWLLAYLMKNPKALEEVRKEVAMVVRDSGQELEPGSEMLTVTREMLTQTPVLDSAVKEALRMGAAPMLIRAVLQDMDLKMHDGRVYNLRKGDKIAVFPYLAAHMDPEIHPEPHLFKYDRFLDLDGNKKEFYKNGEKVKYFTLPWGAGTSMCPGRFFATNEIKLFAFLMLSYFDMELVNKEEEVPPIDKRRYGFGVMQPTHDIQFRYRLRC
ncbi:LOW QUALITY PROTEIN: 7-alpha-hydroxycholest-4-en-3-one 12-alpha-hydroxylase [Sceloporus undulatus]|uniref:LOW QUALITY PROTEIN: 7-alpha-hydroxycholest-4-en-3-one 12-alpha-hydroxylase n=1 Tax=Sceloporus undulatus TaxID=8520 RepID=UPI001C4BA81C|nr:LOW QUALITY PROTEIN: 7-alpha-hydroxycholest-4-en-3-one 12-alpha-hydroxylase [Sceloporus undulatus]